MGKYMRKSKAAGEVALMEVAQLSLGVRTRAKTLALQRLQKSAAPMAATAAPAGGGSYLQLRSRRLEKPPIFAGDSKRQKHIPKDTCVSNSNPSPSPNSRTSSRSQVGSLNSRSVVSASLDCLNKEGGIQLETEKLEVREEEVQENDNLHVGVEASFGENVLEFEGRERNTRESTPCSLIRDSKNIRTPCSTTRPTNSTEASRRSQNPMRRVIPTAHEMDAFFAGPEQQQQSEFIEKYNFDPVNDKPLPGRFEWVKLDP